MSILALTPAAAAQLMANFAQLDPATRSAIFRYLRDDLQSATRFAMRFPAYAGEIGSNVFRSYRATARHQLFVFLGALVTVPQFAPHVASVALSSPFDDPGESGFWEFLLVFGDMTLAPGHFALPVQGVGQAFIDECEDEGFEMVDGVLQGSQFIPAEWHWGTLFGSILPALCPNLVELEIPASWGARAEGSARANFPNLQTLRRT